MEEMNEHPVAIPLISTGRLVNIRMLAALLYDDVEVLAQYEYDHKVAIVWHRRGDAFLEQYQRDRLASGLFATYDFGPGLEVLFDDFYDV